MKYVHFVHPDTKTHVYGILEREDVRVFKGETIWKLSETSETIPMSMIRRYLPPVFPPNIIGVGLNYYAHAEEAKQPIPEEPIIFLKAATSVAGHGDFILLPKIAPNKVDYEGELVVVMGRKAKNLSEGEALEYVLGYTCGNDVSARDFQFGRGGQWAIGKSFDTFCPLGPVIETSLNPSETNIQAKVNNRVLQNSSCGDMIFPVEKLVSYLSRCMTLLPGTAIMTGTPGGVGYARNPSIYLRPGDVVEITVDKIGTLENPVTIEA